MKLRLPNALKVALMAAIAMPAMAVTSSTTTYGSGEDAITFNGDIWTWNNYKDGENVSSSNSQYTKYNSDPTVTYAGNASSITGVGNFYNYFFNAGESSYVGNTLCFSGATSDIRLNTDWTSYVWLGGIITESGDYTYTLGRDNNTNFKLKGTGNVNMLINSSFTLKTSATQGSIAVEKGGSWTVAAGKTLTLSSAAISISSGQTVNFGSGSGDTAGKLALVGAFTNDGTLAVNSGAMTSSSAFTNNGALTIGTTGDSATSGTATLSGAYSGTGSITVNKGSLTLSGTYSGSGSLTIADGGTLTLSGVYGGSTITNNGTVNITGTVKLDGLTQTGGTVPSGTGLYSLDGDKFAITTGTGALNIESSAIFNIYGVDLTSSEWSVENQIITLSSTEKIYYVASGDTVSASSVSTDATTVSVMGTLSGANDSYLSSKPLRGSGTVTIGGASLTSADTLTYSSDFASFTGQYQVLVKGVLSSGSAVGGTIKLVGGTYHATDSHTLASGALTFANGSGTNEYSTIEVDSGKTLKFSSVLNSANQMLVKSGSGTLELTGTGNLTGGLTINGGTVQTLGSGGTGTITGNITINAGGMLKLTTTATDSLGWGDSATPLITLAGESSTNRAVLDFGGQRSTMSTSLALNGYTTIQNGTLDPFDSGSKKPEISVSGTDNVISAGIRIRSATRIVVAENAVLDVQGSITNSGGNWLMKTGAGELKISSNSAVSNTVSVGAGTLTLAGAAGQVGSGTVIMGNGATLQLNHTAAYTFANTVSTEDSSYTYNITVLGADETISSALGAVQTLTVGTADDTAKLTTSGSVSAAVLAVGADSTYVVNGALTLSGNNGTYISGGGYATVSFGTGSSLTLGSGTYTTGDAFNVGNVILSGSIMNNNSSVKLTGLSDGQSALWDQMNGRITVVEASDLVWNGTADDPSWNTTTTTTNWTKGSDNASFSSLDNVTFGALAEGTSVTSEVSLAGSLNIGTVTVEDDYTFSLSDSALYGYVSLNAQSFTVDSEKTLTVNTGDDGAIFLTGTQSGQFSKTGAGILYVEADDIAEATYDVQAGDLCVDGTLASGEVSLNISGAGTLMVTASSETDGTTLTLNDTIGTLSLQGGLLKADSSKLTASAFTVVEDATLYLTDTLDSGAVSKNISGQGTLSIAADSTDGTSLNLASSIGTLNLRSGLLNVAGSTMNMFSALTGSGTLDMTGSDTVSLSGVMTGFTGVLQQSGTGTLNIKSAIGSSADTELSQLLVAGTGTVNIGADDGSAMTVYADNLKFSAAGTVNVNAGVTLNLSSTSFDRGSTAPIYFSQAGVLNIYGGATVNATGAQLQMGYNGSGTIKIVNGTLNAKGMQFWGSDGSNMVGILTLAGTTSAAAQLNLSGDVLNLMSTTGSAQFNLGNGTISISKDLKLDYNTWYAPITIALSGDDAEGKGSLINTNGYTLTINPAVSQAASASSSKLLLKGAGTVTFADVAKTKSTTPTSTISHLVIEDSGTTVNYNLQNTLALGQLELAAGTKLTVASGTSLTLGSCVSNAGTLTLNGTGLTVTDTLAGSSFVDDDDTKNGFYTAKNVYIIRNNSGTLNADNLTSITMLGSTFGTSGFTKDSTGLYVNGTDTANYYVNEGTVTYGASDNQTSASTVSKLQLNGGTLALTDTDLASGVTINTLSASTISIGSGRTLQKSAVTGTADTVTLTGSGTYALGAGVSDLGTTLATGENGWTGTVVLSATDSSTSLSLKPININSYANGGYSKVKLSGVAGWLDLGGGSNAYQLINPEVILEDNGDLPAFNINDGSENRAYRFTKLSGKGTLLRSTKPSSSTITLEFDDISDWTGTLTHGASTADTAISTQVVIRGSQDTVDATLTWVAGNMALYLDSSAETLTFNKAVSTSTMYLSGTYRHTADGIGSDDLAISATGGVVFEDTFSSAGAVTAGLRSLTFSKKATIGGALTLGDSSATGDAKGSVTFNGGTTDDPSTVSSIAVSSASTVTVGEDAYVTVSGLSGSGVLTKSGSGTMTLGGTNYAGGVVVNAGTLKLTSGTQKAESATGFTVNSGATLDVNGRNENRFEVLLKGGTLVNTGADIGSGKAQIDDLDVEADSTIGGTKNFGIVAQGYAATTMELQKHTLTKVGDNEFYALSTTITGGGTLKIAGGTFTLGTGGTNGHASALGSASDANDPLITVQMAGGTLAGNINLNRNAAFSLTDEDTETATISAAINTGSSTATIQAGEKKTLSMTGVLSGAGNVTVTGSGTTTLSGANTYTGITTVDGSTLKVANADAIGSGEVRVTGTSTLAKTNAVDQVNIKGKLRIGYWNSDSDQASNATAILADKTSVGGNMDVVMASTAKVKDSLTVTGTTNVGRTSSLQVLNSSDKAVISLKGVETETGALLSGGVAISYVAQDGDTAEHALIAGGSDGATVNGAIINLAEASSLKLTDVTLQNTIIYAASAPTVEASNIVLNGGGSVTLGTSSDGSNHTGTLSVTNLTVSADSTLNANLKVGGAMTFGGKLSIGCTLTFTDSTAINLSSAMAQTVATEGKVAIISGVDNATVDSMGLSNATYNNHALTAEYNETTSDYTIYATPEPATTTLSLLALAGLAARRRRR